MSYPIPEYRGEYKMEGRLGKSASGPVYCARDAAGRALAVKVLTPFTTPADPELPDRLCAEANLNHKNILAILSLFRNKERICFVTEVLAGRSLAEILTEDQSLSLLERVEIMIQAGEALQYAAANGIAHRSLKPSHVHVLPDGVVKVRSFSVAPNDRAGEARYMAPEQLSGQTPAADALSNIFTFGVILDELTVNCPERRPSILTHMIQRARNQDRAARYQNFNELLADAARLLVRLRNTDLAFTGLFESYSPPPLNPENVQFTVYRPRAVRPGEWKTLLAFAHLSDRPADAPEDEPDPIKDVQQRANQILGKDAAHYQDLRQDSTMPIPQEGELTFVPEMNGIEFNPRRVSFLWQESVHQAAFRLRASPRLDGTTAWGQMCVYLGSIIVAQVALKIEVNSRRSFEAAEEALAPVTAARYRKIFASYSHRDVAVVEEFERYGRAMGDEYLRDVMHLRSGEAWNERLREMIDQADVFQLFWSSSSLRSSYVRREWQYALTLNRNCFVRPVYWEEPLPEAREMNLPPEELRSLHFHRVAPAVAAPVSTAPAAGITEYPTSEISSYAPPAQSIPAASHGAAPKAYVPRRMPLWFLLAAAALIAAGVGALTWYTLSSRRPAAHDIARSTPAGVEPASPQAPSTGTTGHSVLTLWSRGTPILPGQLIRGDDPFLQSSFTPDDTIPAGSTIEVEWYSDGVPSGITNFDPSEKGKPKSYTDPLRDGSYRAVLTVNQQPVASLSFSYQK